MHRKQRRPDVFDVSPNPSSSFRLLRITTRRRRRRRALQHPCWPGHFSSSSSLSVAMCVKTIGNFEDCFFFFGKGFPCNVVLWWEVILFLGLFRDQKISQIENRLVIQLQSIRKTIFLIEYGHYHYENNVNLIFIWSWIMGHHWKRT